MPDCVICRGPDGDPELGRVQVWEDDLWRLTTSVSDADVTPGFSYLEPKRHIPYLPNLDGAEAATLGDVLARVTEALREATDADLVYVYIFGGGIPHLHIHLAPHTDGDALNSAIIRGEVKMQQLPSGATAMISKDFPALPVEDLQHVADLVKRRLR